MASTSVVFPTTPVHRAAIQSSASWRKSDFSNSKDWSFYFSRETLNEIDKTIRAIHQKGKTIKDITKEDFPLQSFLDDADELLEKLKQGCGFVILKGMPICEYTDEEAYIIYQSIGTSLGKLLTQKLTKELLFSVQDRGGYDQNHLKLYPTTGRALTSGNIGFHTDSSPAFLNYTPDVIALLVLRAAKTGGESKIISAQTIHNILLEEYPEYLERLYNPYYFARAEIKEEQTPTIFAPIFTYDDSLKVRYSLPRILKGHEKSRVPLTIIEKETLDLFESVIQTEELAVTFRLEVGDILLVNNQIVLHGRTSFEDYFEPERKRQLVRMWLAC